MKKYILVALGIVVVAVVSLLVFKNKTIAPVQNAACTLEAKVCPDGTSVGRVGPSCEFAECPTSTVPAVTINKIQPKPKKDTGLLIAHITLSPICPVERIPPDPACAPKPYSPIVEISMGGSVLQVHADANGRVYAPLPIGTYTVSPRVDAVYPRCETKQAVITKNATTTLEISCDTGIR